MKAILLLTVASMWLLAETTAMSFESFKQKTLKNSNTINAQKLSIDIAQKEQSLSENYANPSIGAGSNRYENDKGWEIGFAQPVRLPGFGSDLKRLNDSKVEFAVASYQQKRAEFIRNLEISYTEFVYQKQSILLLQRELELAKRIESISKNRLKNGVGTRAKHLRATIETKSVETKLLAQKQNANNYYFRLLELASISKQPLLEAKFIYPVLRDFNSSKALNPELIKIQKEAERFENEAKVANHGIKSIDISAGYEKEPDDKILSFGASMALPIFSTSKERVQLARIKANQNAYELKQLKIRQKLQKSALINSLSTLKEQYSALLTQQESQEKLLKLYQEGYEISKGSLLELIDVKNSLLQTGKNLLDINRDANLQRIQLNYIQGTYNE